MSEAVLVHGAWSSPADWCWVVDALHLRSINAIAPDLPSHRRRHAGRTDDVREVESAIRTCVPPVIVVGWSYGGAVISDLSDTSFVAHLLYCGFVPEPVVPASQTDTSFDPADVPWLVTPDEQTVLLDNEWWLNSEQVQGWPDEVVGHLRAHPRRPITRSAWLAPPTGEAWRKAPTTLVIGRSDTFVPPAQQERALKRFDDVRLIEGGHFLPLLQPSELSDIITQLLSTS